MSTQHEPLCKTDAGSHDDDGVSRCLIVGDQTSALDCLLITMTLAPPPPLLRQCSPPSPYNVYEACEQLDISCSKFLIKLYNTP